MKAVEWQRRMMEQSREHAKHVFTTTELANLTGTRPASISSRLPRLVRAGILERYANGRYGLPGRAVLEELVTSLDENAYLTGHCILYREGLVTQVPRTFTCFTNRRHNRSRLRDTELGRIEFMTVAAGIYRPPERSRTVGPEQAFCDYLYRCSRRGLDANSLVTFRGLERLALPMVQELLASYPRSVRRAASGLLDLSTEKTGA